MTIIPPAPRPPLVGPILRFVAAAVLFEGGGLLLIYGLMVSVLVLAAQGAQGWWIAFASVGLGVTAEICVILLVVSGARRLRHRPWVFNPPPGWPSPDPQWRPTVPTPAPHLVDAPPGWEFWPKVGEDLPPLLRRRARARL